jgi:hypothetical protein
MYTAVERTSLLYQGYSINFSIHLLYLCYYVYVYLAIQCAQEERPPV